VSCRFKAFVVKAHDREPARLPLRSKAAQDVN